MYSLHEETQYRMLVLKTKTLKNTHIYETTKLIFITVSGNLGKSSSLSTLNQ